MAFASTKSPPREITYVLELTESEARYLYSALHKVNPRAGVFPDADGDDPVYSVLGETLRGAGVDTFDALDLAEANGN